MSTRKANKALADSPTSVSSEASATRSSTAAAAAAAAAVTTTPTATIPTTDSPSMAIDSLPMATDSPSTTTVLSSTATDSPSTVTNSPSIAAVSPLTTTDLPSTAAVSQLTATILSSTETVLSSTETVPPLKPQIGIGSEPDILRPATPTPTTVATAPTVPATAPITETIVPESKRPRRSTVRIPTTPSTPSASSAKKKSEPDVDETTSTSGDVDDDKSVKSEGDTTSTVSDSPVRSTRRGRKPAEKCGSSIVTRKAVMDLAKTSTRVLRCDRRNSTGRFESPEQPEVKRRSVRRAACYTPEPGATASSKRKRTNSVKPEDKEDAKRPEKMIKLEVVEPKDEEDEKLKLLVEETDSKDDELVEVVAIKQEEEEEAEVPMEEGFLKDPVEEELTAIAEPIERTGIEKIEKQKVVKKVPVNQKGGKRAAVQGSESGPQKKTAVKKDDVKLEKDSKYEAYERPRRVCQKRLLDLPQTPKRSLRKTEKQTEVSSETKATKSNRKSQGKKVETPKIKIEPPEEVEKKESKISNLPVIVNGVEEPLTVDTACVNISPEKNPPSSSSEQSTDGEGINALSVQKFYKKPEFLENNVGIEKDPKLGEIIQEVEKSKDVTTDKDILPTPPKPAEAVLEEKVAENPERSPSCSGDSLKEGERLVLEDSTEDDGIGKNEGDGVSDLSPAQEAERINRRTSFEPLQDKEDGVKQEEEEILSNSAATQNVDALQTICDSTNVNTAVDEEGIGADGDKDRLEGDTETKDSTACNTESSDEGLGKDQQFEDIEIKSEDVQMEDSNCSSDAVGKEELPLTSEPTETMEVDAVELSGAAGDEINGDVDEKPTIKKELKIGIAEDVDQNIEADADDVKEAKENIKNCINTPKKIEKSDVAAAKDAKERKLLETPETLKQKENHLKNLGLLTHKAAVEAKIEKQRRRKLLQTTTTGSSGSGKKNGNGGSGNSSSSSESGRNSNGSASSSSSTTLLSGQAAAGNCNKNSQEYTGTLKTVIKLNRQSNGSNSSDNKRKSAGASSGGSNGSNGGGGGRQSLKMTFQKGRGRGTNSEKDANQSTNTGEDTYYTIQNETEGGQPQQDAVAHGRKSHNRYHTTDATSIAAATDPLEKMDAKEIVIPEKASSFDIHPGRLCQDQCFYCGGKFGLYDTPCHVAQLKSVERQQKILENEEKLTVDNCLCDACFRHVDRRANYPNSYKKRLSAPAAIHTSSGAVSDAAQTTSQGDVSMDDEQSEQTQPATQKNVCFVPDCKGEAVHSLRRRNIRKTIKKILPNFDLSSIGCMAPTCAKHLDAIVQVLGCALCKRRLVKNQMYINHESERLEKILAEQGIPAKLGNNTAVCKLCRYFTGLLLKPPEIGKVQKKQFVKNYRKRLLHFYNIQADTMSDGEDQGEEKNENDEKQDGQRKIEKRVRKKKSLSTTQELTEGEKNSRADTGTPQSSEDGQSLLCAATSGQMMLDNDVMVDYDMPVPISDSPSPPPLQMPSKLQTILQSGASNKDDISIVLRSNPNISMRELFPGEEEMGLQINVPFGNATSVRTPEGWTRVNTFLQYDEPTRRLWEELQKPYGNQSSFLRHLILLEKFFRNGDLILSQNASSNALVYSDTVQNRLRSYDNLSPSHKSGKSRTRSGQTPYSPEKISKRFGNLPVTITTKLKSQAVAGPSSSASSSSSSSSTSSAGNVNSILKTNLLANNRAIEILPIGGGDMAGPSSFGGRNSSGGMTRQQKLLEAATRLINNQDSLQGSYKKSGSAPPGSIPPELISIGRNQSNPMQMKTRQMQMHPKPGTSKVNSLRNVIVLPESLTPLERMQSKNWRPTLVPVNSVNPGAHLQAAGPLYQTADGRRLPALVQVQSGGKPYLISIHDYNRMCILRRDKLIQEHMLKGGKKQNDEAGNKVENIHKTQSLQHKMHIPNKILEQNSLIPVSNKQLGLDPKGRKQQTQQSLLKSASTNSMASIAPKTPGQLPIIPPSIASQQHAIMLSQSSTSAVSILPTISNVLTLAAPTTSATNSTSWLWSSASDSNTLNGSLINQTAAAGSPSSGSSSSSSSPSALKHQGNAGTVVFDNSVLSKIPKSLTVIPQRKSQGRGNSGDDLTSA